MISAFVGTPGSGKSYEAVQKILENLKLGRKCYTNIEGMDTEKAKEAIKLYCNLTDYQLHVLLNHLDEEQALCFWDHCLPGSLVLIDEIHKLFSNRDWKEDKNRLFTEWSSTHRHEGFDVVLITQDIEKVDKHARSLVEWTYFFRKVNFMGGKVSKKYLCYAYSGDNHTNSRPIGKSVRTYDVRVFACYSSYVAAGTVEKSFMKHVNIFRHPVFYAIPVVLVVFLFIFSKSGFRNGDLFSTPEAQASAGPAGNEQDKNLHSSNIEISPLSYQPSLYKKSSTSSGSPARSPLLDVIICYKMPDGKKVWTNNGVVPVGGRFIKKL